MEQPSLLDKITAQNNTTLSKADFLKQVTNTYPFFSAAQFYLLQSTPSTDTIYKSLSAKTAVLFNNPHWLYFQLQQQNAAAIMPETDLSAPETVTENVITNNEVIEAAPAFIEEAPPTVAEEKAYDNVVAIAEEALPLTGEQLMLSENEGIDDEELPAEEEIAPITLSIPSPVEQNFDANAPAFEPMHLVDYFASQGIKLSDEVQTADKLGKQLKSFTEWLKTMKKVHSTAPEANAGVSDMVIQTLAAKSNTDGKIVTEAMAEVLYQQGKLAKAIEVYQKLSLLNPAKSAFFAAKIEQLKG
jgi:hypothetical protein